MNMLMNMLTRFLDWTTARVLADNDRIYEYLHQLHQGAHMPSYLTRQLYSASHGTAYLAVVLKYDKAYPYVVTFDIYIRPDADAVHWMFARSLLRDGLKGSAGIGDVRVETDEVAETTSITLQSHNGRIAIDFHPGELSDALDDTALICPFDAEVVDVDRLLEELIS